MGRVNMTSNMRAFITKGNKIAAVENVPIPEPAEGEILVKIHYIAQNPTDWKQVLSVGPGKTVGCDFAGTVFKPNGSKWREGQRVAGFVQGTAPKPPRGAFAEFAVIEASLVFPIPDDVTYQQAVVLPLAFATAVQAIQISGTFLSEWRDQLCGTVRCSACETVRPVRDCYWFEEKPRSTEEPGRGCCRGLQG